MRAIEAVTAKGETSALCQSIGVSRASLRRSPILSSTSVESPADVPPELSSTQV